MNLATLWAEWREPLLRWWAGREVRERWLVVSAAVVVLLVLPYVWIWEPLVERAEQLEASVAEQRRDLAWMRGAAEVVAAAERSGGAGEPVTDDRSLLGLVDRSARAAGLEERVTRVQPEGGGRVRVWLERAPFNDLVQWLDGLEAAAGVSVSALTVERTREEGLVNARLTLEVDS
ncbi:hypothetical protein CKO15_02600 [Halorhodospira abdelmalekii]|uniref:type II secretion system protein GspM n=1 Tax=Halorhodospira abdelmalekii TaxID=421629 RepID=UPI00190467DC|nr:type II secretion system protein M [Halorhodospira abdelmalekii]MBK1734189.1 hypothetical protein [Halorhodospira abdelmalekii]